MGVGLKGEVLNQIEISSYMPYCNLVLNYTRL